MFWGVTLESGKRYSQVVDMSYHLSMAALEPKSGAPKRPLKLSKKVKESLMQAVNGDSEDDSDFDVDKVEDGTEDEDDDEDEEDSDEEEPEPAPALPHKRPAKKRLLGKSSNNASPSKEQATSSMPAAEPHDGVPKKKRKKMKQRSEGAAAVSGSPKIQQSPQGGAAGEKGTTLPGGVISTDLRLGNGPVAKPGKNVHVYYTGRLANSHVFDKCVSGKAFSFRLGKHEVIKGWETGIEGMKVGGKRRLVIPPNQAYGNTRMGSIPANSTLYFEVELRAVS
ncbi:hypothetical protein MRX96_003982 [Rhipicephalus microplus]